MYRLPLPGQSHPGPPGVLGSPPSWTLGKRPETLLPVRQRRGLAVFACVSVPARVRLRVGPCALPLPQPGAALVSQVLQEVLPTVGLLFFTCVTPGGEAGTGRMAAQPSPSASLNTRSLQSPRQASGATLSPSRGQGAGWPVSAGVAGSPHREHLEISV